MSGGGPIFTAVGLILLIVGAVIISRAASFQKRLGLEPDQTAPPGPLQTWINRFIGAFVCLFGVALLILGILALS